MSSQAFRTAVENQDMDAAIALLADDVVFRSPVVHRPYEGREATAVLLRAVGEVFEDFRYTREVSEGDNHVLVFHARVGDRELDGADFLVTNDEGLITDFMVMVRPMSGMHAVAEAMKRKLEEQA